MAKKGNGFFKLDRDFLLDERRRRLSCAEREVHLHMSLHSWRGNDANGIHVDGEVLVTAQQLMELTGYQKSVVYAAIAKLIEVGLAKRRGPAIVLTRRSNGATDSAAMESSSVTAERHSATADSGERKFAAEGLSESSKGGSGATSESFRVQINGTESLSDHPFGDEPRLGEVVEKGDERQWIPVTHTRSGQRVYVRA